MRNIYIMSGLPASGKSTWARNHAAWGDFVCSRNNFRARLRTKYDKQDYYPCSAAQEYFEWAIHLKNILTSAPGIDVYIDQTTLRFSSFKKLIKAIKPALTNDDIINVVFIHTPFHICLARNAIREGYQHVPEETIQSMAKFRRTDPLTIERARLEFPNMRFTGIHVTGVNE